MAESCPTCKKPIRTKSGSLTQWLLLDSYCDCEIKQRISPASDSVSNAPICSRCLKAKTTPRPGSLTQWIFAAERCFCPPEAGTFELKGQGSAADSPAAAVENVPAVQDDLTQYWDEVPDGFPGERYKIIKEVGRGYSGIVYACTDLLLNKKVAVKTLYSDLFSAEEIMRFQMEAKAASRFNHPGLVQVLDFG